MIIFKKIRYKNLMATGNAMVEIDFTSHNKNLVIGANGQGKSSVLDAICYALFGKPHRNINKAQLINSVNGKNCYVEIEFSIGSIEYKVCRGMKPNIFDIYQDEQKLNKDADVRDYQKILEQQILKLNYKSFTQVEILGSASFTPFMKITPGQRREVIEDVLDTGIYSVMGSINKEKVSIYKEEIKQIDYKLNTIVSALEAQKKIISSLSESRDNIKIDIQEKIEKNTNELSGLMDSLLTLTEESSVLQNKIINSDKITNLIDECKKRIMAKEIENSNIDTQLGFFIDKDECPSCKQNIPHEHKESIRNLLNEDFTKNNELVGVLKSKFTELQDKSKEISLINKEIQGKQISIGSINGSIKSVKELIRTLKLELEKIDNVDSSNINKEKEKQKELVESGKTLTLQKSTVQDNLRLAEISATLLKDSGIKSSIIREYLPIINSTINKYLEKMDFFVDFQLDESFNEVIKSRYRDEFSYASFSEGEKQRLDIAILLAWRHIAKMKNSINTNILFMDETLNGNLDDTSVELLLDIIDEISRETNVFLITHNVDAFINRFDRVIKFQKQGNFSTKIEF